MAQLPRESVVAILQTLLVTAEANAARRGVYLRDYYEGRASGIQSALDILTKDEDYFLPPVKAAEITK